MKCAFSILLALLFLGSVTESHAQRRQTRSPERAQPATEAVEAARQVPPEQLLAEALEGPLQGYRFNKRLATDRPEDHLLLLVKGNAVAAVAWTTDVGQVTALLPTSPGVVEVLDCRGEQMGTTAVSENTLELPLTREPIIYRPMARNPVLELAAAAQRVAANLTTAGPNRLELSCQFRNPLEVSVRLTDLDGNAVDLPPGDLWEARHTVHIGRRERPYRFRVGASGIEQVVQVSVDNPLLLELWQQTPGAITIDALNPTGEALRARAELNLVRDFEDQEAAPFVFRVDIPAQQRYHSLKVPMTQARSLPVPIQLTLRSETVVDGEPLLLAETPATRFYRVADFTRVDQQGQPLLYEAREPDGGVAVLSTGEPRDSALPAPGEAAAVLAYNLPQVASSAAIVAPGTRERAILARPHALGAWIYGDGSGNEIAPVLTTGRDVALPEPSVAEPEEADEGAAPEAVAPPQKVTQRLTPMRLDWEGWRYVNFLFPEDIELPISWDALLEVTRTPQGKPGGAVFLHYPTLVYTYER